MSVRVFNKRWTRLLEADGDSMTLKPYAFADVPERFTGDITFKMGVEAGDIEIIVTKTQGDKVERKAFEETDEPKTEKKKGAGKKLGDEE